MDRRTLPTFPLLIYPYLIPRDENGERVILVSQNQNIRLGAKWGACTLGLSLAFAKTANVAYVIDDQSILTSLGEASRYWSLPPVPDTSPGESTCKNNTDTGWWVSWEYPLGTLSLGDHPAHFDFWNDRLQIDGGDYDGDGKVDRWEGTHIDFIIWVVE